MDNIYTVYWWCNLLLRSIMSPLGLQMTTIGSLGAESMMMGGRAAVMNDYFWDAYKARCELTPIPATVDFNDCWDLDGTDYMPQDPPIDEGWWEVDALGDLEPFSFCTVMPL